MIQQFHIMGTHFEIGFAIGKHFAPQIHKAYDNYALLQDLRAYHETKDGQDRYTKMLEIHQNKYPHYMEELEGIAEGSERQFVDVFLVNMRGEYRGFIKEANGIRGCADCSVLTESVALIGHNEDGSPAFREYMYFIHAKVNKVGAFTACSYPGFLCGNAFGFNSHGICFSVDNIRPRNIRVGIARHFLARSLLDAESIQDAIQLITPEGRASGFSYTIGSIKERRIVQIEVTPDQAYVKEIDSAHFHANHVLEAADVDQTIADSSKTRVMRANSLMQSQSITNAEGILSILGDEEHPEYPIYRTARPPDDLETFCTALFDLDMRELHVYSGHPVVNKDQVIVFPM